MECPRAQLDTGPKRPFRRVNVLARHVGPQSSPCTTVALQATPTASNPLVSAAPFLLLGAYQFYQSRKQQNVETRQLSEIEMLAEDMGFDTDRLFMLNDWAQKTIATKKIPGVIVAVARKGALVLHEAYGDAAYSKDSIMAIQAMVTPIITATFLTLVDEGLVRLDDDVAKYLPYFSKFRVLRSGKTTTNFGTNPLAHPITLRHLLTDTWGFPSSLPTYSSSAEIRALDALAAAENPEIGNDSDFEKLTAIPLIDQPGQQYRCSIGPSVIAHLICKITGRPFRDVVLDRVLKPLGMEDTDWYVPSIKQHRVLCLNQPVPYLTHRLWGNRLTGENAGHTSWLGWTAKSCPQLSNNALPSAVFHQSDVFSTALDQLRFHAMLLSGGLTASGERVLSQESVRQMTMDQLPASSPSGLGDEKFNSHARDHKSSVGHAAPHLGVNAAGQGIGLGLHVIKRPSTSRLAGSRGTFSSWGVTGTECWSDPALDLTVFVGAQLFPSCALPDLRQEVAGNIYGSLVPSAAAKHYAVLASAAGGMGQMGMMDNMMNIMTMTSMMGGMGAMGAMGGGGAA